MKLQRVHWGGIIELDIEEMACKEHLSMKECSLFCFVL
jgi:hypothetical protein